MPTGEHLTAENRGKGGLTLAQSVWFCHLKLQYMIPFFPLTLQTRAEYSECLAFHTLSNAEENPSTGDEARLRDVGLSCRGSVPFFNDRPCHHVLLLLLALPLFFRGEV